MDLPDLFPGFATESIATPEARIFVRLGGEPSAPPLVLLHGYPQTHVMWAGIAADLARHFRVVVPDLRGYGASEIVAALPDSAQMSKRAMARDIVALMAALGHDRFAVAGHDRGGRVGYRLALDHPDRVSRLVVLDIVPTAEMWAGMNAAFAMKVYHWQFLAQPRPLPETLISAAPLVYLDHTLASWTATNSLAAFGPRALAHYRAAFLQPERVAATCEDYRAGWQVDRRIDEADRAAGRRIGCPMLVLWGNAGIPADTPDPEASPLAIWRRWADDVRGTAIDSGHFLAEENPGATLDRLVPFLLAAD